MAKIETISPLLAYFLQFQLWQGVAAVLGSLLVTTAIAALALIKPGGMSVRKLSEKFQFCVFLVYNDGLKKEQHTTEAGFEPFKKKIVAKHLVVELKCKRGEYIGERVADPLYCSDYVISCLPTTCKLTYFLCPIS